MPRIVRDVLGAMKTKSAIMHKHLLATGLYAGLVAKELGLRPRQVKLIRDAGYVHDIGKLLIPTAILESKKPLSPEQGRIIKEHTSYGAELLRPRGKSPLPTALKKVLPAISLHHEHYDGAGYNGLRGKQIPFAARIVAVADAFDAMISARGYNTPLAPREALLVLKQQAGKQFDPAVVAAFSRALNKGLPQLAEQLQPSPGAR